MFKDKFYYFSLVFRVGYNLGKRKERWIGGRMFILGRYGVGG